MCPRIGQGHALKEPDLGSRLVNRANERAAATVMNDSKRPLPAPSTLSALCALSTLRPLPALRLNPRGAALLPPQPIGRQARQPD